MKRLSEISEIRWVVGSVICLLVLVLMLVGCNSPVADPGAKYLNRNDSVHEVGMNTCRQCHAEIYNTFIQTGMGQSFAKASKQKSAAIFGAHALVQDTFLNLYYHPYWKGDSLWVKEFRLRERQAVKGNATFDTVFMRNERVDYIIGSGQHTNSHLFFSGQYLYQVPMTFYTQKQHWDLPPGFEGGTNTRFSRKIGLECQSCHNAYPQFHPGAENAYVDLPEGINCERCHGPGSAHVALKQKGIVVDTSKGKIDYSIVNPAKLPLDLQFDVCQRCHLQGNAVLKPGKSFLDFKPGMHLSDVMTVFLPKYEGGEQEFIMASHADRLKMSKCFKAGLTCVTCHNPHVSVKKTGVEIFNAKCINCHTNQCKGDLAKRKLVEDNCVKCHMPKSGAIDIPHVRITDHWIQRPIEVAKLTNKDFQKIKLFLGLFAINEQKPDALTLANAYLNQFEKFEPNHAYLLDSAQFWVQRLTVSNVKNENKSSSSNDLNAEKIGAWVRLFYLKGDMKQLLNWVNKQDMKVVLQVLNHSDLSNANAWTFYRMAEANYQLGQTETALKCIENAIALSPENLEFLNKKGVILLGLGKHSLAEQAFRTCIVKDNKFALAYCNLGYLMIVGGDYLKAEQYLKKALALDPNYELAFTNLMLTFHLAKKDAQAKALLNTYMLDHPRAVHLKNRYANVGF